MAQQWFDALIPLCTSTAQCSSEPYPSYCCESPQSLSIGIRSSGETIHPGISSIFDISGRRVNIRTHTPIVYIRTGIQ
jgi:hypothetical protein